MKRLLVVLALAGVLALLGLSHMMAAPPEGNKILVCHIGEIGYDEVVDPSGEVVLVPYVAAVNVIEVSKNAQSAHEGHGDVVVEAAADCTTDLQGLDAQKKADSEADDTE